MNAPIRKNEKLVQGTPEWDEFRLTHDGASEAAAMLGLDPNVSRSDLLAAKHTGEAKVFSQFVQERILDHGHKVEALARPHAEKIIGQALYRVTYSLGRLSASCDGLTIDDEEAFEHKQWNQELAEQVATGIVPDRHQPQCQQILMVTGAKRVLFVVSDGTEKNFVSAWVYPSQVWFERIVYGWQQFHADLENYVLPEVVPELVATPVKDLPALHVTVNGQVSLTSNLEVFGQDLKAFVEGVNLKPSTDQEFFDAENSIKVLEKAQKALEGAEATALAQTASIDELRRTVAMYVTLAKDTRLMLEKVVTERKKQIRVEIRDEGFRLLSEHIASLNKSLGGVYMPAIQVDFAAAMKGKKSVTTARQAMEELLSQKKTEATIIANGINKNLAIYREEAKDHEFLFRDLSTLVLRDAEAFQLIVSTRVKDHVAAKEKEAKELAEKEREKIRLEEEAKAKEKADAEARKAADEAKVAVPKAMSAINEAEAAGVIDAGLSQGLRETVASIATDITVSAAKASPNRPTDDEIIATLALHYRVHESKVIEWLIEMDLDQAADRMLSNI